MDQVMGHLVGKDLYRKLGKKVDGLMTRSPWNDKLYAILKELYTPEEAELVVRMPYGLSNVSKIEKITEIPQPKLQKMLDDLSSKGLLIDMNIKGKYLYTISPMIIGIFEFTMMRTRGELNTKEWAGMFNDYLMNDNSFFKANAGGNKKISPLRALPYEDAIAESDYVEILDYEKASAIIDNVSNYSIGICSCRHEKMHLGEKDCEVPLETCSSFGGSTEYLVRHGMAKEISKTEMKENLERSKSLNLVLCADNVQKNISFICHCCSCCCNVLQGITKMGYPGTLVTSNYIAEIDKDVCLECGICADVCPINAIDNVKEEYTVNRDLCVGCGVCALNCDTASMKLKKRKQNVIHPETTFHRVILQSLERGTLQNLIFDNPQSKTQAFMRGFVGGFLKLPPVKQALMSDTLRSRFLSAMNR